MPTTEENVKFWSDAVRNIERIQGQVTNIGFNAMISGGVSTLVLMIAMPLDWTAIIGLAAIVLAISILVFWWSNRREEQLKVRHEEIYREYQKTKSIRDAENVG